MYVDPVAKELREHGARIAEECGGDVHRMAERFRREQKEGGRRIVRRGDRSKARGEPDPKKGS